MPACNLPVAPKHEGAHRLAPEVSAHAQADDAVPHAQSPGRLRHLRQGRRMPLQDYHYEYNGSPRSLSREPKHRKTQAPRRSAERILLDNERCILCIRCVRFTREISKSNMLGIVERGAHAFVARLDAAVRRRPVLGQRHRPLPDRARCCRATSSTRPRLVSRAGAFGLHRAARAAAASDLASQDGVAAALDSARNATACCTASPPLENPEINGPWICNKGFDQHKLMSGSAR